MRQLSPRLIRYLWIVFVAFHLMAAIFSEGFHRPDEHLGMIRMMMLKLGTLPDSLISWEIGAQIRSWLQPLLYFSLYKTLAYCGIDSPRLIAFFFRFIMALGHLAAIGYLIRSLRLKIASDNTILWIEFFLYTAWFFPFIHVRTTTESFASIGICLLIALCYRLTYNRYDKPRIGPLLIFGIILSTTVFARLQTVLFVAPLIPYLMLRRRDWMGRILTISSLGIALGVFINMLCDRWGYGTWTLSPWNNLYQNLFLGVAAGFGKSPWYYYFSKFTLKAIPLYTLPLILLYLFQLRLRPLSFLNLSTLLFILGHSLISHKELRFLYPVAVPFLILVGFAVENFERYLPNFKRHRVFKILTFSYLVSVAVAALYSSFTPAYGIIGLYNYLYHKPINHVTSLNVVRDPLVFYMGREVEFKYVESEQLQTALDLGNPYILTDKFPHHLELQKNCQTEYLSSPLLVYRYFPKLAQRSKIWGLYYCPHLIEKE